MTPLLFPLRVRIGLVLLVLWAARASAAEKPTPAYRTNQVEGWQLIIDERLLSTGSSNATARAMELLETQLKEIVRNVPSAAVDRLRQVPLWFSPAYPGVVERAEYHPGESWLRANGRNPAMVKAVEFTNIPQFEAETRRMPNFALHELAHAYHDRFLPGGFGNGEIAAAHEKAKASGKYDRVERRDAAGNVRLDRAYALTNPMEYFAETTEAFFSRNDFFPFTRDELKQHDPEMFALLGQSWNPTPRPTGKNPLKVFILAGQSNMEGQAVVDLEGKDYNQGRGTLATLMRDPAKSAMFKHLTNAQGQWTVREDVWVRYQRERGPLLAGPLGLGFSVYGDAHHFGPELQFGHVLGDHFENQVLLIKTAWGGKSLFKDFRPPSSGGEVGPYYTKMIAEIRAALNNLPKNFPKHDGGYELAGFVWYHGWNDGVNPKTAVPEYETNLVNLIRDVRRELDAPQLPVVIGELTGPWVVAPPEWTKLREAQAAAAARPEFAGNVVFVPTHDFVRKPEDSPNPGHGHHEFGNAETYFLVGDALGRALRDLLTR